MNITVNWVNEQKSILVYKFNRNWTWQIFEQALEQGFAMIENVNHQVSVIFDFTRTNYIPDGAMLYWRKMMRVIPSNQQTLIFITSNHYVQTTVKLFADINKRYTNHIHIVESYDEAKALLKTQDRTVLVIEDEDDLREEIAEMMMLNGYDVLEASDGLSGLSLAQNYQPKLIISDVGMPNMNGFEMLEALRQHPVTEHIPVILLTAQTDRADMRTGMTIGADDYITKPFSTQELTNSVHSRLQRLHAIRNTVV